MNEDFNQNNLNDSQNYLNPNIETLEDKKKANLLCIISILLFIVPSLIAIIMAIVIASIDLSSGGNLLSELYSASLNSPVYLGITSQIMGISYVVMMGISHFARIASFVMMIVIRVKYPKNTFGKVLMWIWIIGILIIISLVIFAVVSCINFISSCPS